MHVAQSGIFALGTGSHSYLEFDLQVHGDPLALVQVMANLEEPRMTTGGVNLVVGFRPSLWARAAPEDAPAGVSDFEREVRPGQQLGHHRLHSRRITLSKLGARLGQDELDGKDGVVGVLQEIFDGPVQALRDDLEDPR